MEAWTSKSKVMCTKCGVGALFAADSDGLRTENDRNNCDSSGSCKAAGTQNCVFNHIVQTIGVVSGTSSRRSLTESKISPDRCFNHW